LLQDINSAWQRMNLPQRRMWEQIKVDPKKWVQHPWGDAGGGFWVAAVIGNQCLFYNDIEEGWNWSDYDAYGEIRDYWCNQDELEIAVQHLLNRVGPEEFPIPRCGPPMPGAYKGR
jgi:hypothetical protein